MTTLRVLVHEHWPAPAAAPWILLDKNGALLAEGVSEPQHWPAAERSEAVLMGAQYGWLDIQVPRASIKDQAKSVPFALEAHLLEDVSNYLLIPTHKGAERWSVIVIQNVRIRQLLAQFSAVKRTLDAVYGAVQTIPVYEKSWSIGLHGHAGWVRTGKSTGFFSDMPPLETVPDLLATALAQADRADLLPHSIHVSGTNSHIIENLAWLQHLNIPVSIDGEWQWFRLPSDAVNLLQGEFLPRHRHLRIGKQLKPAIALILAVLLLHAGLNVLDIFFRTHQLSTDKAEMVQLMKNQLPNLAVKNPPLQLQRELNRQRTRNGLLADDEPLSILSDFSLAAGAEIKGGIQALRYESGALTLTLAPGLNTAALTERLKLYNIRAASGKESASQLVLRRVHP